MQSGKYRVFVLPTLYTLYSAKSLLEATLYFILYTHYLQLLDGGEEVLLEAERDHSPLVVLASV